MCKNVNKNFCLSRKNRGYTYVYIDKTDRYWLFELILRKRFQYMHKKWRIPEQGTSLNGHNIAPCIGSFPTQGAFCLWSFLADRLIHGRSRQCIPHQPKDDMVLILGMAILACFQKAQNLVLFRHDLKSALFGGDDG